MSRAFASLATTAVLVLTATPIAAASDAMSTPTPLASGVPLQELTPGYDVDSGEPNTVTFPNTCDSGHAVGVSRTAWYSIQGTGGPARVTTTGSDFDTAVFAYASSASGLVVACNDDVSATDVTSSIAFPTKAGTTYLIQAGSECGAVPPCPSSGGLLRIAATVAAAPPPNHDLDGDGVTGAQFGGIDCNDNDVRVHPGALDLPGDGIDQDCDGHDAAVPRPSKLGVRVTLTSHVHRRYTQIAKLTAWDVPAGATVVVSCTTKRLGCRFSSKKTSVKVAKAVGLSKLVGKALTKAKLRTGARIEVRVTSPGHIGGVTRFTIRKGKTPTKATLCLPLGAMKPQKACS